MSSPKKIYCLSGTGADFRLFSKLTLPGAELLPVNWLPMKKGESMQSYAKKLATQIDTSVPFYLLGVSFGGMLCVELTSLLSPEKTFIVSSARTAKELPLSARLQKIFPLYRLFSHKAFVWLTIKSRSIFGAGKEYKQLFDAMAAAVPDGFYKGAIGCMAHWSRREEHVEKIVQVHGTKDRVIRNKNKANVHYIKRGGHFIVMNKAEEVSRILLQFIVVDDKVV